MSRRCRRGRVAAPGRRGRWAAVSRCRGVGLPVLWRALLGVVEGGGLSWQPRPSRYGLGDARAGQDRADNTGDQPGPLAEATPGSNMLPVSSCAPDRERRWLAVLRGPGHSAPPCRINPCNKLETTGKFSSCERSHINRKQSIIAGRSGRSCGAGLGRSLPAGAVGVSERGRGPWPNFPGLRSRAPPPRARSRRER